MIIPSTLHTHTHTTTSAHVEIFTTQPVVTSLRPHCAITVLLSPCGNVMTDYGAGTEQEMSHNLPDWFYIANCSVSPHCLVLLWSVFCHFKKSRGQKEANSQNSISAFKIPSNVPSDAHELRTAAVRVFHMHGSKRAAGRKTKGEISVDRTDCRVVHSCDTTALGLSHHATTGLILFCMYEIKAISTSPFWNQMAVANIIFY